MLLFKTTHTSFIIQIYFLSDSFILQYINLVPMIILEYNFALIVPLRCGTSLHKIVNLRWQFLNPRYRVRGLQCLWPTVRYLREIKKESFNKNYQLWCQKWINRLILLLCHIAFINTLNFRLTLYHISLYGLHVR